MTLGMYQPLLPLNKHNGAAFVEALRAASPDYNFTSILANLLDQQVNRLCHRVGLVPNYFMTRGESTSRDEIFHSFKAFGHKISEKTFKLFHQKDFREEKLYSEFDETIKIVQEVVVSKQESSFTHAVAGILNRQTYKDGDSLLQVLVKRRHLRFVRTLLLHAGDLLDLDQRNRKGYSAMDLAFDRLEVEMVYLLLLYGVTASYRINPRSSLGYAEWIGYDMLLNLDTGRWLHKKSELAVMKHAEASMIPELRGALMQWAMGEVMSDGTLQKLGRMPRLFTIVLADGCDAITNHEAWASMIRHLSLIRDQVIVAQDRNMKKNSDDITGSTVVATPCSDLYEFLKVHVADTTQFRTAGRTVFFGCNDGSEIAVKMSKTTEDEKIPHPLGKEAFMNSMIAELKLKYGLLSDYPETIQLLLLSHVPEEIRRAIESQQSSGYHPFSVSSDKDGVVALVYRPPKGYSLYANDSLLPLEACRSGIDRAGYDSAVLARHGLYHGALVDIQHDSSREQRPHLWSFESFLTRFRGGAGRIEKGFAGLGAPNVRASGLGDLKHLLREEQIKSRYDPSVIHAQHNILYDDDERFQVCVMEQLGASLFATALLAGSSWQSRNAEGVPDSENLDLAQELQNCFTTFLRGYLQVDLEYAEKFLGLVGTDFELMAAQIKMFSTPDYVAIAETSPRRPIFGFFAKISGWLTHPTFFCHFAQRGSLDLSKPDRSLPDIQQVYVSQLSDDGYPRVDTSMMRCSPTWIKGKGWANGSGQSHFGSYEGVLPFQQLIRDLYAVVDLAAIVHEHDGFDMFKEL